MHDHAASEPCDINALCIKRGCTHGCAGPWQECPRVMANHRRTCGGCPQCHGWVIGATCNFVGVTNGR